MITDLGGVPGTAFSQAVAINERGQVIGNSYPCVSPYLECSSERAFFWQKGRLTKLGSFGGKWTAVRDLNDSGQVVGSSTSKSGTSHAFLWNKGAAFTDLGTLPGMRESVAVDINDHGQVVGVSYNVDRDCGSVYESVCDEHAFLWQRGKLTDLGTLGGKSSAAVAINELGQVIGWSKTRTQVRFDSGEACVGPDTTGCVTPRHAFLWQKGRMSDLGTLPFHTIGSWAVAINGHTQIAGAPAGTAAETATTSDHSAGRTAKWSILALGKRLPEHSSPVMATTPSTRSTSAARSSGQARPARGNCTRSSGRTALRPTSRRSAT